MLREDVLGYFTPGEIPVICAKASSAGILGETTALHEAIHEHLARTTAIGQYGIALRKLWQELDLDGRDDALLIETLIAALVNASRLTQEGYATWAQFYVISLARLSEFETSFESLPKFYQSAFTLFIDFSDSLRIPWTRRAFALRDTLCYALAGAAMSTHIFHEFPAVRRNNRMQFMSHLKTLGGFPDLRLKTLVERCRNDEGSPAVKNLRTLAAAACDEHESDHATDAAVRAVYELAEDSGLPVDWDGFAEAKCQVRGERLVRALASEFGARLDGEVVARPVELTQLQYAWSFEDIERIPPVVVADVAVLRLWFTERAKRSDTRFVGMIYTDATSHAKLRFNVAYLSDEGELLALNEIRELAGGCDRDDIVSVCRDFQVPLVTFWELFWALPPNDRSRFASGVESLVLLVYNPSAEILINVAARLFGQVGNVNVMEFIDNGKVLVLSASSAPYRVIAVLPSLAAKMLISALADRQVEVTPLSEDAHGAIFLAAWMATYGPLGDLVSKILTR
jgi:hypothetical protein